MPEKNSEDATLQLMVSFPKTEKKDCDQKYSRFVALVDENKNAFPSKVIVKKRKKRLLLDAEDFVFTVFFEKGVTVNIMVRDPQKNKAVANEMGSKVINYLNTVLDEEANGASVNCMLTILSPGKKINLAVKLLGEGRVARINELMGLSLKPLSIGFEYTVVERDFLFSVFFGGTSVEAMASHTIYKGKLPFDLLEKEISELDSPMSIIKRLTEAEV